jgi:hypothetical protein
MKLFSIIPQPFGLSLSQDRSDYKRELGLSPPRRIPLIGKDILITRQAPCSSLGFSL